jgi:mono/diheme cytochrome c family protein
LPEEELDMSIRREVNAPLIWTVGIVSALLLLVVIFGMQAWFYAAERDEIARKWEQAGNPWLDNLRREQTRNLTTRRWVDVEKQIVTMPIDRAAAYVAAHGGRLPASTSPDPAAASKPSPTTPAAGAPPSTRATPKPKGLAEAGPAVKRGKSLYVTLLCATCHSINGARLIGPTHLNLLGREETLTDGSRIVVDEAYLRESILDPQKRVVKDFPPIMPAMKDKITDAQLDDLIAYLRFLSPDAAEPTSRPEPKRHDQSSRPILSIPESALAEVWPIARSRFLLSSCRVRNETGLDLEGHLREPVSNTGARPAGGAARGNCGDGSVIANRETAMPLTQCRTETDGATPRFDARCWPSF